LIFIWILQANWEIIPDAKLHVLLPARVTKLMHELSKKKLMHAMRFDFGIRVSSRGRYLGSNDGRQTKAERSTMCETNGNHQCIFFTVFSNLWVVLILCLDESVFLVDRNVFYDRHGPYL
jgi:hypothetical protein